MVAIIPVFVSVLILLVRMSHGTTAEHGGGKGENKQTLHQTS